MSPGQTHLRPFLWQSGFLVLPVLILAAVGIYLLRQDKSLIEQEAREQAKHVSGSALSWLQIAVPYRDLSAYTNYAQPWPEGTAFFQMNTNLELVFPPPILDSENSNEVDMLAAPERVLWKEAEKAEFRSNDFAGALQLRQELLDAELPEPARTLARFNRAVLLVKAGHGMEASQELAALRQAPLEVRTDAGFPVRHLAGVKLLALLGEEERDDLAVELAQQLLQESTRASPVLLEGARATVGGAGALRLQSASRLWRDHQLARYLYDYGNGLRRQDGLDHFANFHAADRGNQWYGLVWNQTNVFLGTERALGALWEAERARHEVPEYLRVELTWSGNQISANPTSHPPAPLLASSSFGGLEARVLLSDPQALFALQRQRALWIGGIIGLSAVVAFAGVANNYRVHRKQARLNDLKTNFVSSVSHELRAPLASMRLLSEGLQSGRVEGAEKQREYYDFLVQESRRLSVLVENILDFSRIEQGRKIYEFQECDLAKIAQAAVRSLEPIASERGVRLACAQSAPPGELISRVDPLAIQQALINLLDNAIKHSPERSEVRVRLGRSDSEIQIAVVDQGPGIDPAEHPRIFERFYRLGSELRRETPGVGIGLSIVRHTIEAHGGKVQVQSTPGGGSTFTIHLPIAGEERPVA